MLDKRGDNRANVEYAIGSRMRRLVRAAGNIRVLLLGLPGVAGSRRAARPIATGTFAFPALSNN